MTSSFISFHFFKIYIFIFIFRFIIGIYFNLCEGGLRSGGLRFFFPTKCFHFDKIQLNIDHIAPIPLKVEMLLFISYIKKKNAGHVWRIDKRFLLNKTINYNSVILYKHTA